MITKEQIVRDFVDFLRSQHFNHTNNYEENLSLSARQVTNNSSNDYDRQPTTEEVENLISRYLATERPYGLED